MMQRLSDAWAVLLGREKIENRRRALVVYYAKDGLPLLSCFVADVPVALLDQNQKLGHPLELPAPNGHVWRISIR